MDSLAVVLRLGNGKLLDDICDALTATAAEVVETGKPGMVTVKFKVSNKQQGDVLIVIDETVSRASPKDDPKGAYFFAVDGELHREDPRQAKMEFREVVNTKSGEIRSVGNSNDERIVK